MVNLTLAFQVLQDNAKVQPKKMSKNITAAGTEGR
jgi:hypothetical protein